MKSKHVSMKTFKETQTFILRKKNSDFFASIKVKQGNKWSDMKIQIRNIH
jgi:hypothetical protein